MAKIPVSKVVSRNGQSHVQTYWEENDKSSASSKSLSSLGVRLPGMGSKKPQPVVDQALAEHWQTHGGDADQRTVDAALAAGLQVTALQAIQDRLPEGVDVVNHIYDEGLDTLPRPKGGWGEDANGIGCRDHRVNWHTIAEVPLDKAVEWIEAGYTVPWAGIPDLIRNGVPVERVAPWSEEMARTGSRNGSGLYLAQQEITSGISYEQAVEYRNAFSGKANRFLGRREISFIKAEVPAALAARWDAVVYDSVTADQVLKLKETGWTPTAIKSVLKSVFNETGKYAKVGPDVVDMVTELSPQIGGPKKLNQWSSELRHQDDYDTESLSKIATRINDAEAFKTRVQEETGMIFRDEQNYDIMKLLPQQREALIAYVKTQKAPYSIHAIENSVLMSHYVSSAENLEVLKDNEFTFMDSEDQPYKIRFSDASATFDAGSASTHERNVWMKELAFRMYSDSVRQQSQRDRWTKDDDVSVSDIIKTLHKNPSIKDLEMEALIIAKTAPSMVDGFL